MTTPYKIRAANDADKNQIRQLVRKSIAGEKKLLDPGMVHLGFMEEFVDKVIRKGNMLVVENRNHELELIGEVHNYNLGRDEDGEEKLREYRFFSKTDTQTAHQDTDIIIWLFNEIRAKHKDVFRVELCAPVENQSSIEALKKMGLTIKGNFTGRLRIKPVSSHMMIPMVWTNPLVN